MKRALSMIALAPLAACPSEDPTPTNPAVLWLALDGSELEVRLVPEEPRPY